MGRLLTSRYETGSHHLEEEENMEQMKSSVHPGDENKGVVAENLSSVGEKDFSEETIVVDDSNESNDMEEEVNFPKNGLAMTVLKMLMGESAFQKQNNLSTQKSSETVRLNANPKLDHNLDPSIDLNANPNLDLNVDNNLDLSLDCGSCYRSSSTSNFQAHTRMRASPNPLLGQGSFEQEEQDSLYEMDLKKTRL
ncbi:hypothetical protein HID58_000871 [Brassica napus]|uniref:Uncharacterized protein n=1 Tax=Brassica napus TaxID=3708 RepID=A0ABQ8EHS1_BRANA|nr:hypothetical protein HID58_000871 [Brassica napus]